MPARPSAVARAWAWERWHRSPRAPDPARAAELRARLDHSQPGFVEAVAADARVAARYRGERHDLASTAAALGQALRLAWVADSFLPLVLYRAAVACRVRRIPVLPRLLSRSAAVRGQIRIGDHVVVEPGVYLPHGQVVIDGLTHVGRGAVLRPFVTLGLVDGEVVGPDIGAGALVGTGAKVVGPVRVGAGAQIGANAVVVRDVAPAATVVGVPARPL